MVKQRKLKQTADQADWLIGADILGTEFHGDALRSMKAPGHRLRRPAARQGPAAGALGGLRDTVDDNGGVHINSGIPNHAFYLLATNLGGRSWQTPGRICRCQRARLPIGCARGAPKGRFTSPGGTTQAALAVQAPPDGS